MTVPRFSRAPPARHDAARRGAPQMEWFAATARSLFATTPRLNVTLDSQSGESLVVDENADTHARKRCETQLDDEIQYVELDV